MANERERPGRLIAIEGLDGSGKTTQARALVERLWAAGIPTILTAEPTNGSIGRLIRELIGVRDDGSEPQAIPDSPLLALLFAADRRDHLHQEIQPTLRRGEWVVCDRYLLSSLAYQTLTPETDPAWIAGLNRFARPADLTIYLRLSVAACLDRLAGRGGLADIFETAARLRRIARSYRNGIAYLRSTGALVVEVDGRGTVEAVAGRVARALHDLPGG